MDAHLLNTEEINKRVGWNKKERVGLSSEGINEYTWFISQSISLTFKKTLSHILNSPAVIVYGFNRGICLRFIQGFLLVCLGRTNSLIYFGFIVAFAPGQKFHYIFLGYLFLIFQLMTLNRYKNTASTFEKYLDYFQLKLTAKKNLNNFQMVPNLIESLFKNRQNGTFLDFVIKPSLQNGFLPISLSIGRKEIAS